MKQLQKNSTAWIITICVVAASILLGAKISLSKERTQVWEMYRVGTQQNQFVTIHNDIESICGTASNLLVVASRYMETADPAIIGLQQAKDNIAWDAQPGVAYSRYVELQQAIAALNARLDTLPLSETDRNYQVKLTADIESSYKLVSQNAYNTGVREFNALLQPFPANILSDITGVKPLELFGS